MRWWCCAAIARTTTADGTTRGRYHHRHYCCDHQRKRSVDRTIHALYCREGHHHHGQPLRMIAHHRAAIAGTAGVVEE
uniref:Putative secreted protein n=1 Tax=Anopheles darlingi TaxID=43151 RepID=A0A2M4D3G9_ANODA